VLYSLLNRSLALLLSLLSNPELARPFHKKKARRVVKETRKVAAVEQVLLVPHTELAKQFEGWLESLKAPPANIDEPVIVEGGDQNTLAVESGELGSKADLSDALGHRTPLYKPFAALEHTQVVHRQSTTPISINTRFLITTPRCLVDMLDKLAIDTLHTIALDEADEMLNLPNRFHTHKDETKWMRHPPLLLSIMDDLLSPNSQAPTPVRGSKSQLKEKRIVAVSASANSVFRDYLVRRSGWLKPTAEVAENGKDQGRQFDWYDFSSDPLPSEEAAESDISELQRVGRRLMPQANIEHFVARLNGQGDVIGDSISNSVEVDAPADPVKDSNRFLVGTATLFALKEVESGLLLISSGQSLQKTIDFLKELAVPAIPVSEAFELARRSSPSDEPVLYVASVDSIRGLDIPGLEWIFMTPDTKAYHDAKDYMHISGRVGRLLNSQGGRGTGKVVTLLDQDDESQNRKLANVWQLLGIEGEKLEVPDLALLEEISTEDSPEETLKDKTISL
jgi:hypothetical protein